MRRILTWISTAAFILSVAGFANAAAPCKDAKGKFIKCPAAEAAVTYTLDAKGNCHGAKGKLAPKSMCSGAATAASATTSGAPASATSPSKAVASTRSASTGGPNCTKGKRCGNACISVKEVCHK